MKRCRPWRGGLKGLTSVGDWGEEVVDRRKVGFDDEDGEVVDHEEMKDVDEDLVMGSEGDIDDESEGEGTERPENDDDDASEAGSEGTEKPDRGRLGAGLKRHSRSGSLWAEESFDESVYNTAEGEDELSDEDHRRGGR